ncbi:adenine DNA glycosylase isoform X1 [Hydra vulgaris]|uniref:adenine DNA glycosylase isoform X1 n=1 Tax=Hydra vulgaris TaxID=6087 RepID=UPI001F5ED77B|nr:adenine DNA glycosylase-like isoform X1 [Hydra vulgaris]XP_047123245.1 adenine DNA glycosylase-like isoform X1 [Hydra vulgaris]
MKHHQFTNEEIIIFRKKLLAFYDKNKRDLPWRLLAKSLKDSDQRGYAVWVSEIMLQQTQVATVINYYNNWMKKWPSIASLASATLEEVNEAWSGLGYYSRGRRLHEAAKKLIESGQPMPKSSKSLVKELPGIGPYTASAIASIAFNEVCGVVDGNVIRVLTRIRMIGADSSSKAVNDFIWELANTIVDEERPGDFNQGMMELGATVCTPKSPQCSQCPLSTLCMSYKKFIIIKVTSKGIKCSKDGNIPNKKEEIIDIENIQSCKFCLADSTPWDSKLGVMNFPRKNKNKSPLAEEYDVAVIQNNNKFLLVQRPNKGLLAGLWEFPLFLRTENSKNEILSLQVEKRFSIKIEKIKEINTITHIFSHRHHTYHVVTGVTEAITDSSSDNEGLKIVWLTKDSLLKSAISTAVKKIFKECEEHGVVQAKSAVKRKREVAVKGQRTLDALFSLQTNKKKKE